MESLPSTSLSFSSVIRGHHVYKTIRTPYYDCVRDLVLPVFSLWDFRTVCACQIITLHRRGCTVRPHASYRFVYLPLLLSFFKQYFSADCKMIYENKQLCRIDQSKLSAKLVVFISARAPSTCKPRPGFNLRQALIILTSVIPPASI